MFRQRTKQLNWEPDGFSWPCSSGITKLKYFPVIGLDLWEKSWWGFFIGAINVTGPSRSAWFFFLFGCFEAPRCLHSFVRAVELRAANFPRYVRTVNKSTLVWNSTRKTITSLQPSRRIFFISRSNNFIVQVRYARPHLEEDKTSPLASRFLGRFLGWQIFRQEKTLFGLVSAPLFGEGTLSPFFCTTRITRPLLWTNSW